MEQITEGGSAFKQAWMALPKDRKRAITKAVQAGQEVAEETAVAVGYAARQIKTSWMGYVGIIGLAFAINAIQGEDLAGTPLTWAILGAIVVIGVYSYAKLFQARSRNLALLAAAGTTPADDDDVADEQDIERLQDEGGPVTEVAEPHPAAPPEPATPSAPVTPAARAEGEPTTGE